MASLLEMARPTATTDDGFLNLVDGLSETVGVDRCRDMLFRIVETYGLANVAYLGVNLPGVPSNQHFGVVTYEKDWVNRYIDADYFHIDPVIPAAMRSLLPLDWSSINRQDPALVRFFGEAEDFRVGNHGLSFPIRGRLGESALFSISTYATDREWYSFRRRFMKDFQTLAFFFHEAIMRSEETFQSADIKLSRREIECLSWAAAGKTFGEIATILALSERTIKFYLDVARIKLRATNVTQAVSKAVAMNVIRMY